MEVIKEGYIRVSEVLGQLKDFSQIPPYILKAKQELGTKIHEAIEQVLKGRFPNVASQEFPYLESFLKWQEITQPTLLISEERMYCDEKRLTGKVDALIKLQGEEEAVVIDWKTSAQIEPLIWPLQGHAYHYLASKNNYKLSPIIIYVKLDSKGGLPKVQRYPYNPLVLKRFFEHLDTYKSRFPS